MAYTLYITRASHHAQNDDHQISLEEWRATMNSDVTLERHGPEGVVAYRSAAGEPASHLFWKNGNICCTNPDPPTVDKLIALADMLQGRVMGEDAELYSSGYEQPLATQYALFEQRLPNRLRVRFPEKIPTPRSSRNGKKLSSDENRMPVGFPSSERKPSAAIMKLLGHTGENNS